MWFVKNIWESDLASKINQGQNFENKINVFVFVLKNSAIEYVEKTLF